MVINWKVRFRNPVFWISIISMAISLVYDVLALMEVVPAISADTLIGLVKQAVNILAFAGVLVDPTTEGLSDSKRAMQYEEPWKDGLDYYEASTMEQDNP